MPPEQDLASYSYGGNGFIYPRSSCISRHLEPNSWRKFTSQTRTNWFVGSCCVERRRTWLLVMCLSMLHLFSHNSCCNQGFVKVSYWFCRGHWSCSLSSLCHAPNHTHTNFSRAEDTDQNNIWTQCPLCTHIIIILHTSWHALYALQMHSWTNLAIKDTSL